jgi:hypothetical protein
MQKRSTLAAGLRILPALALAASAYSQTWHPLAHQPSFQADVALQLTDGTVIVHQLLARPWWKLTPDSQGSYVNGTWSQIASLPSGYGPLYFASAVLPDGRVVVNGGEYNITNAQAETNKGAIYDPVANTWTSLAPPAAWSSIGDATSVVLTNGKYMIGSCCTNDAAILNPVTLTWTIVGQSKTDPNAEEGWTLLPDGSVLNPQVVGAPATERYVPKTSTWVSAGNTPVSLVNFSAEEIGPSVLRPNRTVFAMGATGHNAVYTIGTNGQPGSWAAGPDFPVIAGYGQLDVADGPAALLPNGNVLVGASPGVYKKPTYFFEFDGTHLIPEPSTPNSVNNPSYAGRMLVLPTGQILYTDGSTDVEVYNPIGGPHPAWLPVITSAPAAVTHGQSYVVSGTLLNGVSQGAMYGDDAQSATNYPLVRITNHATGHVFYCRTHDHSSMAVASKSTASTHFDVPAGIETGAGTLQVVASGLASAPVSVTN